MTATETLSGWPERTGSACRSEREPDLLLIQNEGGTPLAQGVNCKWDMGMGLALALNPNHRKSRHWHKEHRWGEGIMVGAYTRCRSHCKVET